MMTKSTPARTGLVESYGLTGTDAEAVRSVALVGVGRDWQSRE
jgi:hypothetical protein